MRHGIISIIFFLLVVFCASCSENTGLDTISGAQLKGEWILQMDDNHLLSYQFSGDSRISRTLITPVGYKNMYREGYYDIDNNNIVIFINEYDSINDLMEYTRSCDWQFVGMQDSILTVVDKDVQLSLSKVVHVIDIDLSKNRTIDLTELFDEVIIDIKVFDREYVHAVKSKGRLMGLTHGTTYVEVFFATGLSIMLKVNVISNDLDAYVYMHKLIGCPFQLVDNYWGAPDYEQSDMPDSKMFIVNNCHAYATTFLQNTLLVDAITIMYGDFISGDVYTDEYVKQYIEERYTFLTELDGEWYYIIDEYSPDQLLIAINPEGDYMYIY